MTMRIYAKQHALEVGRITVAVEHRWVRDENGQTRDHFDRSVHVEPMPLPEVMDRLMRIAERCPVYRTLMTESVIVSRIDP